MDAIDTLHPHWLWLALGLLLAVAEMAVPGVFLIWLSGAALVTGLAVWLVPLDLPLQVMLFAALAFAAVFSGRRWLVRHPIVAADPLMNRRGDRAVGETAVVTQAIEGGTGHVRLGDTEWLVKGPDLPAGVRVRITGSEGTVLLVEAL